MGVIVFAHTCIYRDVRVWEVRFSYILVYTEYVSVYTIMGFSSRGSAFQMYAVLTNVHGIYVVYPWIYHGCQNGVDTIHGISMDIPRHPKMAANRGPINIG
jgi:hypothetical protein